MPEEHIIPQEKSRTKIENVQIAFRRSSTQAMPTILILMILIFLAINIDDIDDDDRIGENDVFVVDSDDSGALGVGYTVFLFF